MSTLRLTECRLVNTGRSTFTIEYRTLDMKESRQLGRYSTITQAVRDIGYTLKAKPIGYLAPVDSTVTNGWVPLTPIR